MTRPIPEIPDEFADLVIKRPDGFYLLNEDGDAGLGPFSSLAEALADIEPATDSDFEPGETLEEAEAELGIADWIDPETGALAEDSIPRLEE